MKRTPHLEKLLPYYQNEMNYLLRSGSQFAALYPKIASRIDFGASGSDDPHVGRLLESFAFLSSTLQLDIDEHFSDFTVSLLSALYPQFIDPLPSVTMMQFSPNRDMAKLLAGKKIPGGSLLFAVSDNDKFCRFHTTSDVTLWPLEITDVDCVHVKLYPDMPQHAMRSPWLLKIRVTSHECLLSDLPLETLRFYIGGDAITAHTLYEWIFSYDAEEETPIFIIHAPDGPVDKAAGLGIPLPIPRGHLKNVGFKHNESLFPCFIQTSQAYRLLLEFFAFPQKFLFFDTLISPQPRVGNTFDLLFPLGEDAKPSKVMLSERNLLLNCTPAINLFQRTSEPILLDHRSSSYRLVGDYRNESSTEIHTITKISGVSHDESKTHLYSPYFSFNHEVQEEENPCFWIAKKTPVAHSQFSGTDTFLSFVDSRFKETLPSVQTVYAHTLCTNRHLAESIPPGAIFKFEELFTGIQAKCLERPTPQLMPPADGKSQWHLISHLCLNHIGICGQTHGAEPLKELLRLYNFIEHRLHKNCSEAIKSVGYSQVMGKAHMEAWRGFVPQLNISLSVQDSGPQSQGVFLLGVILNEFFSLSAHFNTLVETTLIRHQQQKVWKKWAPRFAQLPCL